MSCKCENCDLSKRVSKLRDYLNADLGAVEELATLDQVYSELVHTSLDHDVLSAIIDNQWPSAEEYMKNKGWVREPIEKS